MPRRRAGKKKEQRLKNRLMNQSPSKRYEWLLSLRESTDCIRRPEDKYRIYRRLEDEFLYLSELEGEEAGEFTEQEKCGEYSEECGRIADEMEVELPEEVKKVSRTVMMSAGERQAEDRKNQSGPGIGRWIFLAVLVLVVGFFVCFKIPTTRSMIGDAMDFIGMESFALKSYRVAGESNNGWEKAVALECELIGKAPVGQKVSFGKQDWIVLDHKDGRTLITAETPLKNHRYHKSDEIVTWKDCSLRHWLNDKFLSEQFYPGERDEIAVTKVPEFDAFGDRTGEETEDKVYIASSEDIEQYEDILGSKINNLRLRDQGEGDGSTAFVSAEGDVITFGFPIDEEGCYIRPMMWINNR